MKLLGIDYGRRRIGIAVTDISGTCIRGCPTLDRKKHPDYIASLVTIISVHKPELIIIGLPLGPHDEDTPMSREIQSFAKSLGKRLNPLIEIHFVDESFSSHTAAERLAWRKKKDRRNKELVDRLAACTLLETYQKTGAIPTVKP